MPRHSPQAVRLFRWAEAASREVALNNGKRYAKMSCAGQLVSKFRFAAVPPGSYGEGLQRNAAVQYGES